MKLVTCDIETTGLNPEKDKVLEIGLVLYDSEVHGKTYDLIDFKSLPTLSIRLIHQFDLLPSIPDIVKEMNKEYLTFLENHKNDLNYLRDQIIHHDNGSYSIYRYQEEVLLEIMTFLWSNGFISETEYDNRKVTTHQNFAGKNFSGFDRKFLDKIFDTTKLKIRHRVLDPSILYLNSIDESNLPDLKECKIRSGLFEDNTVSHTAIDDSMDTLKLILNKLL